MEEIKKNIENIICWDKRLEGSKIRVEVFNGHVILTGAVPCLQALESARNDALIVPGVISVESRLKIRKRLQFKIPPDRIIRERIRKDFSLNPDIQGSNISVYVSNGEVALKGNVNSYWAKLLTTRIAYQVIGVIKVLNDLSINIKKKQFEEAALH